MQEIAISEFKAKCLAILQRVQKTKEPIRITRHGKPVAEVIPAAQTVDRAAWIGSLKGKIKILGDIVSPVIDLDEIEALRD
jgi:prevent-host-death family protein